jgi:hypothetical protein
MPNNNYDLEQPESFFLLSKRMAEIDIMFLHMEFLLAEMELQWYQMN